MPQETYNLLSLDEDIDEERGIDTKYAPFENMLSAAHLVTSLLLDGKRPDAEGVYAIPGDSSMQMRGARQSTRDVDLVTGVNMKGFWRAITGVERLVIPDSRLVEGMVKVFAKTGPCWDSCRESHRIEVDINQKGFMGSSRDLANKTDVVGPFELGRQSVSFHVLDIPSVVKIKVSCYLSREEERDFHDVAFMIASHTDEVREAMEDDDVDEEDMRDVLIHRQMSMHGPDKLAGCSQLISRVRQSHELTVLSIRLS